MSTLKFKTVKELVNQSYGEYVLNERWKEHRPPEYFEYRRKWYENPEKMIVEEFPIHLDIEVTNYCNLGCTMCPRTILVKEGTFGAVKHIELDFFKQMIDEGAEYGVSSVKFNYLGEPLMHPDIIEMVRYSKEKGIVEVMFNTNGMLLSEKMSQDLLDAGIDSLFVSFDSAYKDKFEEIRVGAKYEKIIENVRKFSELRNSNEKYWHVQFRVSKVIFPGETQKEFEDFIDIFGEYVDAIGFGSLDPVSDTYELEYNPNRRCDQPWQRLFVRQSGVAFPCCLDHRNEYVLGNAKTKSLKEIWDSELYRNLREAHATGRYNEIDICKNCSYLGNGKIKIEN